MADILGATPSREDDVGGIPSRVGKDGNKMPLWNSDKVAIALHSRSGTDLGMVFLADKHGIESLEEYAMNEFDLRELEASELHEMVTAFWKDFSIVRSSDLKLTVTDKVATCFDEVHDPANNQYAEAVRGWLQADNEFLLMVTNSLHRKLFNKTRRLTEKEAELAKIRGEMAKKETELTKTKEELARKEKELAKKAAKPAVSFVTPQTLRARTLFGPGPYS